MQRTLNAFSVAIGALLAAPAFAADITWSTGPGFGGASGHEAILTNGELVAAVDIGGGAATRTVDPGGLNMVFTTVDPSWLAGYIFDAVASAGSTDAGWNAIIRDADWNSVGDLSATFLTGLTAGAGYQIQLFAADTRGCCASRQSRFGDGNGNLSDFVVQGSLTSIVGTFIADGSTQVIDFDSTSSAPILNAYVLRQVSAVPEPATLALWLAGLGLLGGAVRRSRR